MRSILIVAVAALLANHSAIAAPQISGTPAELREHLSSLPGQVTIFGSAERRVEADRAVAQLSVVTSDRQLGPALASNRQIRTDILAKLKTGGVAAERVHTSRFGSTPIRSSYSGKVKEYQVESTVRIHAETEEEIQLIAGLVDTLKDVGLSSLTFEVTEAEEVKAELLKAAFERVQERRKLYEASLGVRLQPRSVGLPAGRDDSHARPQLGRGKGYMPSLPSSPYTVEVSGFGTVLHALKQKGLGISQFEELVYKASIAVTFDLLPGKEDRR